MRKTRIGKLEVSAIGLGCAGLTVGYGKADPVEVEKVLHRALDIGITFLDTANNYGSGSNEELLGRVLASRRKEIQLATKFGHIRVDGELVVNARPDQAEKRCDESLKRLQTDVIDLYYLHRLDPNVPIEDTVGAMSRLVEAGKVRYLGLSEITANTLRRAHAVHPITAVQSEYSLWTREPEEKVLPTCRELGVGFVPFCPLGRAMLTGAITGEKSIGQNEGFDLRTKIPRFQGDNLKKNLEKVEALNDLANSKGCTSSHLALAWLLAQGDFIVPIPGTKRVKHLEENALAVNVVLTESEISSMSDVFKDGPSGERYPEEMLKTIER